MWDISGEICVALLIVCVTAIVIVCANVESSKKIAMAEIGYEQVMLPGSSTAKWQKAD